MRSTLFTTALANIGGKFLISVAKKWAALQKVGVCATRETVRAILKFASSLTINTAQTCTTRISSNVSLFPLVLDIALHV